MDRVEQAKFQELRRHIERQLGWREARVIISFIEGLEQADTPFDNVRHALSSLVYAADEARVIVSRVATR